MSGYIGTLPIPLATQQHNSIISTSGQTAFTCEPHEAGFEIVWLNGVKLKSGLDYSTDGTVITLATGAALNDILEVVAFTTFNVANVATNAQGALADTAVQPADLSPGSAYMVDNYSGTAPVAAGSEALAIGQNATAANTDCIAIGNGAKASSTSATSSISIGKGSGANNNKSQASICIGQDTLCRASGTNKWSYNCTIVGRGAKVDSNSQDVYDSTSIGVYAKCENIQGTAVGANAEASAHSATAIGKGAKVSFGVYGGVALGAGAVCYNVSAGNSGIAIGGSASSGSVVYGNGPEAYGNGINIGNRGSSATTTQIRIGTSSHSTVQVGNTSSDSRDKVEIEDLTLGLDFINKLGTKTFVYNNRDRYDDWDNVGKTEKKDSFVTTGIIAQEVLEVLEEVGFDKQHNIIKDIEADEGERTSPHEAYIVKMDQFIAPLMKAVQELSDKNDALEARLALLEPT